MGLERQSFWIIQYEDMTVFLVGHHGVYMWQKCLPERFYEYYNTFFTCGFSCFCCPTNALRKDRDNYFQISCGFPLNLRTTFLWERAGRCSQGSPRVAWDGRLAVDQDTRLLATPFLQQLQSSPCNLPSNNNFILRGAPRVINIHFGCILIILIFSFERSSLFARDAQKGCKHRTNFGPLALLRTLLSDNKKCSSQDIEELSLTHGPSGCGSTILRPSSHFRTRIGYPPSLNLSLLRNTRKNTKITIKAL